MLLQDFTETSHGKDPGSVRWEPRIRVAGSSSGAFSCADSHGRGGGGGGGPCSPSSLRPSPAGAWHGQWPQDRNPPPLGLMLTGGQASRPELLLPLPRLGPQGPQVSSLWDLTCDIAQRPGSASSQSWCSGSPRQSSSQDPRPPPIFGATAVFHSQSHLLLSQACSSCLHSQNAQLGMCAKLLQLCLTLRP